jgi:predicted RNA-binding Zn-ribbon protein involved in translation (DUF1610 family)
MSEPHGNRVLAWIREKWGEQRPCPYCGEARWDVGPPVVLGASPAVPVVCGNCGNTLLIDAGVMGVVPEAGDG